MEELRYEGGIAKAQDSHERKGSRRWRLDCVVDNIEGARADHVFLLLAIIGPDLVPVCK